jgi:predicted nuclease with TOPRIM domain
MENRLNEIKVAISLKELCELKEYASFYFTVSKERDELKQKLEQSKKENKELKQKLDAFEKV